MFNWSWNFVPKLNVEFLRWNCLPTLSNLIYLELTLGDWRIQNPKKLFVSKKFSQKNSQKNWDQKTKSIYYFYWSHDQDWNLNCVQCRFFMRFSNLWNFLKYILAHYDKKWILVKIYLKFGIRVCTVTVCNNRRIL